MNYPNKIKIGVCGGSHKPYVEEHMAKAYQIGQAIAKAGCISVTGATWGYPYQAAKGAKESGGISLGISPADGKSQHWEFYQLPFDACDPIVYSGTGLQGRNVFIIRSSDAVIFIGGGSGTLNEFTSAFRMGKPLGVLKGSGKISEYLETIIDICKVSSLPPPIFHEEEPQKLVSLLINVTKQEIENHFSQIQSPQHKAIEQTEKSE